MCFRHWKSKPDGWAGCCLYWNHVLLVRFPCLLMELKTATGSSDKWKVIFEAAVAFKLHYQFMRFLSTNKSAGQMRLFKFWVWISGTQLEVGYVVDTETNMNFHLVRIHVFCYFRFSCGALFANTIAS
jgi:hypothetical protein